MSILSTLFARKGARAELNARKFRLFHTVGTASQIRRFAMGMIVGDYECLRIFYLNGHVNDIKVTENAVITINAIPDGCRADWTPFEVVAYGEDGCSINFAQQNEHACCDDTLPLSASEFRYVNGKMIQASSEVTGYAERTIPVLEQMRQYYAGRTYRLQNLRFTPADLQCLCTRIALGRLPRSLMCYYDSNGCSATVPENPQEGAEILAAPLDRPIARFHAGAWELYETTDMEKGEFMIDSEILMFIGRKPVHNAAQSKKQSA